MDSEPGAAPAEKPSILDPSGRRAAAIGVAVALLIYLLPFTRFVASYLAILVHELGHTAAAWAFGYSAIPTFDFFYGGGITFEFGRHWPVVALVVVAWLGAVYRLRGHRRLQLALAVALGVYSFLAAGAGHRAVILAAGHGAELLVATLFWYRALRGDVTATERPLYAASAAFLQLSAVVFAWRLATSALYRQEYGDAKGGGHWMDFDRLAAQLRVDLVPIALLYLVAALLPALLAWLILLNRQKLVRGQAWLAA